VEKSIETSIAQPDTIAAEQAKSNGSDAAKTHTIGVQLVANGQPDVPMLANFARVQMSATAVVVDFGFLEPDALQALSRMAGKGEKMPAAINGRLAARIALEPEALASLYRQLGQVMARVSAARRRDVTPKVN
jgi:hypothetical protein